jgi:hypothetical protein
MILPMFVPSRWRARRTDESEAAVADEFVSSLGEATEGPGPAKPADQPTRLTPTRAASAASGAAVPWPAAINAESQLAAEHPLQR